MPDHDPIVSVIMSVQNEEKYVAQAIESILQQTFSDFEFIIIDDGSNDKTSIIIRQFRDPRIIFISNKENIGLTKSLNKGIALARAPYIARQDGNDASIPQRFQLQVSFLDSHPEVGVVGGGVIIMDSKGKELHRMVPESDLYLEVSDFLKGNPIVHSEVMMRKSMLDKAGWYRDEFRRSQDYDLWLRIIRNWQIVKIDKVVLKWRFLNDSVSVSKTFEHKYFCWLALQSVGIKCEGLAEELSDPSNWSASRKRKAQADSYVMWCRSMLKWKQKNEALKLLWRALLCDPWNRDCWGVILRFFVPQLLRKTNSR